MHDTKHHWHRVLYEKDRTGETPQRDKEHTRHGGMDDQASFLLECAGGMQLIAAGAAGLILRACLLRLRATIAAVLGCKLKV